MPTKDHHAAAGTCVVPEYHLMDAPQVEPRSSYWGECPQLRMVRLDELRAITDDPTKPGFFPPYPDPCTPKGKKIIEREMEELLKLSHERDDPCKLVNGAGANVLQKSPCGPVKVLPEAFDQRAPISKLLNLTPPAIGEVVANRLPGQQIIRTGRGMARAVESETPGLYYRQALNYLITRRSWSPPRQALVWSALDIAIASALQAAWYYKWRGVRPQTPTSRRERPIEYAVRNGIQLNVLFDRPDELNPNYVLCPDARGKTPDELRKLSPGTPRHPAYPSGHSTYSGAASTVLAFFFGNDPLPDFLKGTDGPDSVGEDLRNMADNIGMGRLWAGIHWRSDHEAGLKLGQVVACLVLRQLANICGGEFELCPRQPAMVKNQCDFGEKMDCKADPIPTVAKLEEEAKRCREHCTPCDKPLPDRDLTPCDAPPQMAKASAEAADLRSVQQGGGN